MSRLSPPPAGRRPAARRPRILSTLLAAGLALTLLGPPGTAGASAAPAAAPEPRVVYGANYGAVADESRYQRRPNAARIYYRQRIPADLTKTGPFSRPYNDGVRTFLISWKDENRDRVRTALRSLPDNVTVYGTYFHEPEDDIARGDLTLAAWTRDTNAQAKIMRRQDIIPTTILMAFTVVGGKGRDVSDYYDANVAVFGFDYYPDKIKQSPRTVINQMAAASRASGSGRLVIGEFGVPTGSADGPALTRQAKRAFRDVGVEVACYWSQSKYALNAQLTRIWFE